MKSKSIFLMAVSLGFGLVAAIGITQVMGRNNAPVAAPEEPKLPILVSIEDIDIGEILLPEMFAEEEWPARLVGEGVATGFDDIEGMATTARVGKKGTLLLSNLVDKTKIREKRIPVGFKVIGIKMGGDDHLDGLLEAGDLVDIMVVSRGNRNTSSSTKTFLRKIRIWSIGSRTTKDIEQTSSAKGTTVVGLLVTEKQAERIVLAEKIADLKLALRGKEDALAKDMSDGTNSIDDEGNANVGIDALAEMERWKARMLAAAGSGNSTPTFEPTTTAPMQIAQTNEPFIMQIFTGGGPTEYTFDRKSKAIVKKDGYESADSSSSIADEPEDSSSDQSDLDLLDLDDDESLNDSEPSDESLDSEPNS